MRQFFYYTLLGTVAAAAIIGGAVLFSGADRGQAEALELGERNIPAHAAASPIRRCMNMGGALGADTH